LSKFISIKNTGSAAGMIGNHYVGGKAGMNNVDKVSPFALLFYTFNKKNNLRILNLGKI
jgi:hypothetical protein